MKAIVTGGAGFIGSNAAMRRLGRGDTVVAIDNLSRVGGRRNLEWLKASRKGKLHFIAADVRDARRMRTVFAAHRDAGLVLHLAAQVAVTTSVTDPRSDMEHNVVGTFNVLEAVRQAGMKAPFVFSSTNKVYGGMEDVPVVLKGGRYAYKGLPYGAGESRLLDFHSPYGCSKGAADQYVRDYHRIYGLNTVVLRQSCIYGCRQFGIEDQGWVAWFMIAARLGWPLCLYGDGRQVRDILFVEDLLDAFDAAASRIRSCAGQVFNIGGGPGNVFSPLELISYIQARSGRPLRPRREGWRPGDQRVYVSDIRKAARVLRWKPRTGKAQGLERLYSWIASNEDLLRSELKGSAPRPARRS